MSWHVCVPVGSSSSATSIGIPEFDWISVRVCDRSSFEDAVRGGRDANVSLSERGAVAVLELDIMPDSVICYVRSVNIL